VTAYSENSSGRIFNCKLSSVQRSILHGASKPQRWSCGSASYAQRGTELLVEKPCGPLTPSFDHLVSSLALKSYRTLLAHPERNPSSNEPNCLVEFVQRGTLLQVTASSLSSRVRSDNMLVACSSGTATRSRRTSVQAG
jgi:hypothetical protein